MKLVHLSDLHATAPGRTLYGLDTTARIRGCFSEIARLAGDASLTVITGDLTQEGDRAAYEHLAELLPGQGGMPVRLMLGNHDDRQTFRAVFPNRPVDADGFVQWVEPWGPGRLIFLDSHEPGEHAGRYCARRRAWLADQLARARAAGDPVWLFMHHPPFPLSTHGMDPIRMVDDVAFHEVLHGSGADLRHLFLGHLHRSVSGVWRGLPYSVVGAVSFQATEALYGQPVVLREGPASLAIVQIDERQTAVHTHHFGGGFAEVDLS